MSLPVCQHMGGSKPFGLALFFGVLVLGATSLLEYFGQGLQVERRKKLIIKLEKWSWIVLILNLKYNIKLKVDCSFEVELMKMWYWAWQ